MYRVAMPDGSGLESATPAVSCEHCGDDISVYEPLMVCEHGRVRETSRATEQDDLGALSAGCYHRDCYRAL